MKTCIVCNIEKEEQEFTKNGQYYRRTCKICDAKRVSQEKAQLRNYINDFKTKCERCGHEDFIPDIFDFHHKNPKLKKFGISSFCSSRRWSALAKKEVDEEIFKCVLLCANCHREYHYLDKNEGYVDIEKFLKEIN